MFDLTEAQNLEAGELGELREWLAESEPAAQSEAAEPTPERTQQAEAAQKPAKIQELAQLRKEVYVRMAFRCVGTGEFWMGSDDGEAYWDEKPVHKVTLDEYWIG